MIRIVKFIECYNCKTLYEQGETRTSAGITRQLSRQMKLIGSENKSEQSEPTGQ